MPLKEQKDVQCDAQYPVTRHVEPSDQDKDTDDQQPTEFRRPLAGRDEGNQPRSESQKPEDFLHGMVPPKPVRDLRNHASAVFMDQEEIVSTGPSITGRA